MNEHSAVYSMKKGAFVNTISLTPAQRAVWRKLLLGVMRASRAGDDRSAVLLFKTIGRALGVDAMFISLECLAERAASPWLADDQAGPGEMVGIEVQTDQGEPSDIEALPYPVRWAARMVAAAANRDRDALLALVGAALDDGRMAACVPVLAQMAAEMPEPAWTVTL